MARTSKTVIGGGSGERSDRMMRAAESGQAIVARERDRIDNARRENAANWQNLGQGVANSIQQKASMDQQQSQFDAQMQQRSQQFDRQMAAEQQRTDLDAAKAGFERNGTGNDRASRLQAEMDRGGQQTSELGQERWGGSQGPGQGGIGPIDSESQGRLREQGSKPLELDGTWRPTEERKQQAKRENFQADTERIRAEAYRDQVGAQMQKAQMKGDKDEAKTLATTLVGPVNGMVEQYDRFMKGEPRDSDWGDIADAARGSEEMDPTLSADIKAKQFTPRVQAFMRAAQSREALKYIVRTGDVGNLKIDWTTPQMRAFTEQVSQFNALAKSMGPEFAQFAGINSVADKMSFLNMQAAIAVYTGMDSAPDPTGGMMPSAGAPPEGGAGAGGEAPMDPNSVGAQNARGTSDPYATDQMTQRAIEARRQGQNVPPTDSPEFRRQFGNQQRQPERPSYTEMKRRGL